MSILRSAPNRSPLKYRSPIKISKKIRPAYLTSVNLKGCQWQAPLIDLTQCQLPHLLDTEELHLLATALLLGPQPRVIQHHWMVGYLNFSIFILSAIHLTTCWHMFSIFALCEILILKDYLTPKVAAGASDSTRSFYVSFLPSYLKDLILNRGHHLCKVERLWS